MASSAEKAEEDYMRMKMAGAKIRDDDDGEESGENKEASQEPVLDDTISADAARSLKEEGNSLYKSGDYDKAIEKYSAAASSAHASSEDRAVYLANRAAAYLKRQDFENVVKDTTEALKLKPGYAKALARRKEANEALKHWRAACTDAKTLGRSSSEIQRLQFLADEKDKKDREEAINSLKGLGNSILSNFGMSLDDFAMEKDPNTGGYSVQMKR